MICLENDILRAEINESDFALRVTDRRCDTTWDTPDAGLHLQIYDIGLQAVRWFASANADNTSGRRGDPMFQKCATKIEQTSRTTAMATVAFSTIDIGLSLHLQLDGAEMTVTVPDGGWDRTGEHAFEVLSLDLFPQFGGRPSGADGYLVMPNFGGSVRYFADREDRVERMTKALGNASSPYGRSLWGNSPDAGAPQSYTALAYGYQPDWQDLIAYPLWGAVCGNSGWAAYVPFGCGDTDAALELRSNQGADRRCSVHGRFHYREHPHDTRNPEDRKLVFEFLHGDDLDYAAVGRAYRRYLLEVAGVSSLKQKCSESPQSEYLRTAYYTRPMLALKRYSYVNNPNPDGKGILDVYMTSDELSAEMKRWKRAGVEKALVQIVGANSEGHDGCYPTYFPLEPKTGGEKGFTRLITTINDLDFRSSVHVNVRLYARCSRNFRIENVLRDRDGGTVFIGSGPDGDTFNACPEAVWRDFVKNNFARLEALGLDGGLYTDFLLGVLFRCYHPLHPLTRGGYLDAVRTYLATAGETFGAIRTESTIAPLLDITDMVTGFIGADRGEACMRGAEATQRGLADEAVPLQAIIFHGIIMYGLDNCCLGEKDYWQQTLTLASIGGKPIEELRGPQPQWDDLHVLQYKVLCKQMGWLQLEYIENIERLGKLTKTTYSDGTIVWVNGGIETETVEDREMTGRSFRVIPATGDHDEIYIQEDRSILEREPAPFPDGSKWPDGRPREGIVVERHVTTESMGTMIGNDFV